MKNITIAGNCGKDAVTRTTNAGDKVTGWTVAVEERNGQDKRTLWFDVSLWGKRGETLAQYLTKGSKVLVQGEMKTRKWTDKEGNDKYTTEITVRDMKMLGSKPQPDDGGRYEPPTSGNDSDIPF